MNPFPLQLVQYFLHYTSHYHIKYYNGWNNGSLRQTWREGRLGYSDGLGYIIIHWFYINSFVKKSQGICCMQLQGFLMQYTLMHWIFPKSASKLRKNQCINNWVLLCSAFVCLYMSLKITYIKRAWKKSIWDPLMTNF